MLIIYYLVLYYVLILGDVGLFFGFVFGFLFFDLIIVILLVFFGGFNEDIKFIYLVNVIYIKYNDMYVLYLGEYIGIK